MIVGEEIHYLGQSLIKMRHLTLQLYGLSVEWTCWCFFLSDEFANVFSHFSHLKGFSPANIPLFLSQLLFIQFFLRQQLSRITFGNTRPIFLFGCQYKRTVVFPDLPYFPCPFSPRQPVSDRSTVGGRATCFTQLKQSTEGGANGDKCEESRRYHTLRQERAERKKEMEGMKGGGKRRWWDEGDKYGQIYSSRWLCNSHIWIHTRFRMTRMDQWIIGSWRKSQ